MAARISAGLPRRYKFAEQNKEADSGRGRARERRELNGR